MRAPLKYTANYSNTNHNFVIQGIVQKIVSNDYSSGIAIIKNILQRGAPTLMSGFLQENLGPIHRNSSFNKNSPLIAQDVPNWKRIIRGDVKKNYFPAEKFFFEIIPKYMGEYRFVQQLLLPEVPINEITQVEVDEFKGRQVDFYLPQAFLVIEIDGAQHDQKDDLIRDNHLSKYGIKTIRISTDQIQTESSEMEDRIKEIIQRIKRVENNQNTRIKQGAISTFSLKDYKLNFEHGVDINSPIYKATAIIRFQILVLELIDRGLLDFNKSFWKFQIVQRDVVNFAEIALEDLFLWMKHIFQLHKVTFEPPTFEVEYVHSREEFDLDKTTIKIDFSLLERYTDEFQEYQEKIILVRTDYFDEYMFFKKGDSVGKLESAKFKQYDYFKISSSVLVDYTLRFGADSKDKEALRYILWNVFLQTQIENCDEVDFREGQLPIIANALSRTGNGTIGLLPTGSGKSICYQLSALLQPAISFVVCPIKSLMFDQKADLDNIYFTRTNHITGEDEGEDRSLKENEFGHGKFFFIFISPERFQSKSFRKYLSEINSKQKISYAVIDEAHCLSEWGHDFRTSYLCLSSTIKKFCKDFRFLGLTATASLNVLKDIQLEFEIGDLNVKSPDNYGREELDFHVLIDRGSKEAVLADQIAKLNHERNVLTKNSQDSLCGIVFTPFVNGKNGCHSLSKSLGKKLNTTVEYYSGSIPNDKGKPIMSEAEFLDYKNDVQDRFKRNDFTLLCATKAFGMGVNKQNIYYTFHFGIPGSMESLYQEAGRAGRDKNRFLSDHAQCHVLLTESDTPEEIWDPNTPFLNYTDQIIDENGQLFDTSISIDFHQYQSFINQGFQIERGLFYYLKGDVRNQFYLFVKGDQTIEKQQKNILDLLDSFYKPGDSIEVNGQSINCSKEQTEKALYRLLQLGIVRDWTIRNYNEGGEFEVEFIQYDEQSIRENLFSLISKYDSEFSSESLNKSDKFRKYLKTLQSKTKSDIEKYTEVLLEWSYYNFTGNRKQSLKDVYENCVNFGKGLISQDDFKSKIEAYFQFNENSFTFQHIADNADDYKKWFEVFYQLDKNRVRTRDKVSLEELSTLQANLSRFLESYIDNTGLNMVSGIVRLLQSDFDNPDGRKRLERSLNQIFELYEDKKTYILEEILDLVKDLGMSTKNELTESLCKFYTSDQYLSKINLALNDEKSRNFMLARASLKLQSINHSLLNKNG